MRKSTSLATRSETCLSDAAQPSQVEAADFRPPSVQVQNEYVVERYTSKQLTIQELFDLEAAGVEHNGSTLAK
jgi:hypothetical protein